jgi:predicted GIY-YIG superfamily endonuclease
MLRDQLVARLKEIGGSPDYQRLAADVLGIRGAPPDLARRLVAQALVVEDRRESWRRAGQRICAAAPPSPGVYILRDDGGRALYVGKANNLRRRLRAHFAGRRWKALKAEMSHAANAEWLEVGSELEALLREAALIQALQPIVNVQTGPPDLKGRDVPRAIVRDVLVIVPSIEADSVELVGARIDGGWLIQRSRRNGADLTVHVKRLMRFFHSPMRRASGSLESSLEPLRSATALSNSAGGGAPARGKKGRAPRALKRECAPLAPLVFSWLSGRGSDATRLDPHDALSARELRVRLTALLQDERLFAERLDQRATCRARSSRSIARSAIGLNPGRQGLRTRGFDEGGNIVLERRSH